MLKKLLSTNNTTFYRLNNRWINTDYKKTKINKKEIIATTVITTILTLISLNININDSVIEKINILFTKI